MHISRFTQRRLIILEHVLALLNRQSMGETQLSNAHLVTGMRGEDAAYFHLRRLGFIVVARRWRSPRLRGDIDLVGWDGESLCFIEVKTRTSRSFQPAEAAVDREKQKTLGRMAREYLRNMTDVERIPVRFDVVSVYFTNDGPEFELFRGAFGWQ